MRFMIKLLRDTKLPIIWIFQDLCYLLKGKEFDLLNKLDRLLVTIGSSLYRKVRSPSYFFRTSRLWLDVSYSQNIKNDFLHLTKKEAL